VPIQELTTSLCNQLALVRPEDGGDTILRNVGSYRATRCHFPEDDNHHIHRRGNLKSYIVISSLQERDDDDDDDDDNDINKNKRS
jgi:hypothetical protein